jgi:hypothetical protein
LESVRIRPSEIIAFGAFVGWFMTQIWAKNAKLKRGLKWLFGFTCALAVLVAIWPSSDEKGNNQSAIVNGTGNAVIQAASGAKVSVGVSDSTVEAIRQGLLAIQKEKDSQLRRTFTRGYVLFAATERNEIVPLNSPFNEILQIDWKSGYKLDVSETEVTLQLPDMNYYEPGKVTPIKIRNNVVAITRRSASHPFVLIGMNNSVIGFEMVSNSQDSVAIAIGVY